MSVEADVLEQMVRRQYSPDAEVRNAALQQIHALPDEDLLQLLANHTWPAGPNIRLLGRRMLHPMLYASFAFAVVGALTRDPLKWILIFLGGWIMTMALITLSAIRSARRRHRGGERAPTRLFGSIASFLIGRTDTRFLPYLLSGLSDDITLFERAREGTELLPSDPMSLAVGRGPCSPSTTISREIVQQRRRYRKLLKAMLSQIGPEETPELSAEQRHALLIPLQMPEEDVELTLALLTRLEQWGDAQAAPALKRLIREKHWYVGSDQVEAAARRCLEKVQERLLQRKQGHTLLRPAPGIAPVSPQALLRPATDRTENAPEQLLRPGSPLPPENSS